MKNNGSYDSDIRMYGTHKLDKIAVNRSRNEFGLSVGNTKDTTVEYKLKVLIENQFDI